MSRSEHFVDVASSTATQGWANVSGQVYGFVDPSWDSDWYATYLTAGITYTLRLFAPAFDGVLALRNASGGLVSVADFYDVGGTEALVYTPATSGVHYVDVQSYSGSAWRTGFYLVGVNSTARDDYAATTFTTSTLTLGQARSGSIEIGADADWHKVTLTAGQTYTMAVTGSLPQAFVQVFDADGAETGVSGLGAVTFRAEVSGVYHVEVASASLTATGSYALTVREPPTLSISGGAVREGDVGASGATFVVRLSAPSALPVTVRVASVDGTAVAGVDYRAVDQLVTIAPGQTSAAVSVQIYGNPWFQPHRVFELALGEATGAVVGQARAFAIINDDDRPPGVVLPSDDQFGFQWYLHAVRAPFAWAHATGKGVKVGVFDQGIDVANAELRPNTDAMAGRSAATLAPGGQPVTASDLHGTFVAGVIGAARDGRGIVGVAYDATLVSIYSSLELEPRYLTEIANAFTYAKSLDVLNNSWGFGNLLQFDTNWAFLDDAESPLFAPAFRALRDLAANGRGGLGTVVVQSAGNGYRVGDDTNLHNFQNSRYVITVGATDFFGQVSPFSTNGASILVSAPGGGGGGSYDSILTTDRNGALGKSAGELAFVDGTSFSAPVVSGIVALMLEVNPRLGYRDVQQILAYTALRTDIGAGEWEYNGATNWNGGGMHYNALEHASGFGQVDALAAVRLAASWDAPPLTVAGTKEVSVGRAVGAAIPDDSFEGSFSFVEVGESMVVERADVRVNVEHSFVGDLSILLLSPAGTTSVLLWRPSQGALSAYGSSQQDIRFTFDTVLNWGEDSRGIWTLGVFDLEAGDTGRVLDWTLTLIGRPPSADDVYVYTSEYPQIVAADPSRAVLRDTDGGYDTLNAAALGLNNRIDLSGRTDSILNGARLAIAPGTLIEAAVGGDGDDVLIGNALANRLRGGPGNDSIDGGGGIDMAVFASTRADYAVARWGSHWIVEALRGNYGTDLLTSIERVHFADAGLALDTEVTGHAGQTAQILRALFGPSFVRNAEFVAIGLGLFDQGQTYEQIVALAISTPLFAQLAGGRSNRAFVEHVYENVVGMPADSSTAAYYTGLLDQGSQTQTSLGVLAAQLDLNARSVELVGLVDTGLPFGLPGG